MRERDTLTFLALPLPFDQRLTPLLVAPLQQQQPRAPQIEALGLQLEPSPSKQASPHGSRRGDRPAAAEHPATLAAGETVISFS